MGKDDIIPGYACCDVFAFNADLPYNIRTDWIALPFFKCKPSAFPKADPDGRQFSAYDPFAFFPL